MVAGSEVVRVMNEVDEHYAKQGAGKQHEQSLGVQNEFKRHVCALQGIMQDVGNPFTDDGEVLVTLDAKRVMDHSLIQTLRTIEKSWSDTVKEICGGTTGSV